MFRILWLNQKYKICVIALVTVKRKRGTARVMQQGSMARVACQSDETHEKKLR